MFSVFVISFCLLLKTLESSQQSLLLLATDKGIKTFSLSTSERTTLSSQPAKAIDFRYKSKDVYFISNSSDQIFYSFYSEYSQNLSEPVPRVTSQSSLSSLAVDWVSFRLYYGNPEAGVMLKETLQASSPENVTSQVFELKHFALDPYERVIFFNTQGLLFSVTLDDDVINRHDLADSGLSELTGLALDIHTQEVYMVCRWDGQWVLGVKGYDPSAPARLVYVAEGLQGVTAITVYHGFLAWASPCEDDYCLYSCQRDYCQHNFTYSCDNFTYSCDNFAYSCDNFTYRSLFEVINDLKFYTPLVQTPDLESACRLCSHKCLEDSAECTCPEGMEVEDDGVGCKEKPPSWDERIKDFFDEVVNSFRQWFNSLMETSRPYMYTFGGLILALSLCCICLLATVPCSKPACDTDDEVSLNEIHHPRCPNRQNQQLRFA